MCRNGIDLPDKKNWKATRPLKTKIFMWIIFKSIILTIDNLLKRNRTGDERCDFCSEERNGGTLILGCFSAKYI
jgi:hypothetical protein